MNSSAKQFYCGFIAYLIVLLAVLLPSMWPLELNLIFDSVLISAIFLFLYCCLIIGYLFYSHGGSSRNVRFTYGILLVISAALLYSQVEEVTKSIELWKPLFPSSYFTFFIILKLIITYAKDIISFGIAALGANVAATAITENLTHHSSGTPNGAP